MRTKEEILANRYQGDFVRGEAFQIGLLIEVLVDIRDLLSKENS